MPRSLVFGNGTVHLEIDKFARLRDLYFPYVGLENHVGGIYMHRIGVFIDGVYSWLDDGSWQFSIISNDANQGITTVTSERFGITMLMTDALHHKEHVYFRKYVIKNHRDHERTIKLFVNHQFDVYQTEKGDTAYFDPEAHAVVHYEGRRAFTIGMKTASKMFDDYTVGIFQIEGKEGAYKDAEDGMLTKNPIEHGKVDSVIAITVSVSANGSSEPIHYWIAIGGLVDESRKLHERISMGDPQVWIDESAKFWSAWTGRLGMRFYGMSEQSITLFNRSQVYLRSHVDKRGAIIASCDSDMLISGRDTYSYMWPRDGAYVATALDLIGDRHNARTFFEFANSVLSEKGYFLHKYRPDMALGSSWHGWIVNGHMELPIQEDETALVIWALWEHWNRSQDLDFISSIYSTLVVPTLRFMLSYRDLKTGLPKPSYNLWEEKFAIHTYTASSVVAALRAGARFAEMLGDTDLVKECEDAATSMAEGIVAHCYENESFIRSIYVDEHGNWTKDLTVDASSAYGVFIFGVLPVDDPRLMRAVELTRKRLAVETPIGGIARYEGDNYHRRHHAFPGNPWIITTLWYAQYDIMRARSDHDLDEVRRVFNWVESMALRSGILPEQMEPYTGEHLSASPLTWSHAEYIRTVMMYLEKTRELGVFKP